MTSKKTIAIVGSTGNQGGSVATLFSTLPEWHVRGLTRDPSKPSASQWKEKGIELVAADIDSPSTLKAAFSGASVIFGTTDFWQHIQSSSAQEEATKRGVTVNEIAYERELQQGKNLIDAAAATETLDRFILSTLSDTLGWSKGTVTFNLHFDGKFKALQYLKETYPELWKKTSLVQLGFYADNWKTSGSGVPKKGDDGKFVLSMPMSGDKKFPIVDVVADTGSFAHALLSLPPNTNLIGCGSYITWNEFAGTWGRVNNVEVSYSSFPASVLEQSMGTVGRELGDMFTYMDKFGYDGGDPGVIYPWEAKEKFGVDIKYTTIEEYFKKQDWKAYL